MPTLDGISYEEVKGSGRQQYDFESGWRATRVFQIAWSDVAAFSTALLGWSEPIGGFSIRVRGQQYPGNEWLFCRGIQVEEIGKLQQGAEMAVYDKAKITATYLPHNFPTSTEDDDDYDEEIEESMRHWEETWNFAGEFLTVPDDAYVWVADGDPTDQAVGIVMGTVELSLYSSEESVFYRNAVAAATGSVNSAVWYGWNPGYVMFLGAASRRTITPEGSGAWEITYRFRARSIPYNYFFRPGAGGGWQAVEDADGDPPYASYNFRNLFA